MGDVFEVKIKPVDYLNPRVYGIEIRRNDEVILYTSRHPASGEDLDFAGALAVAAMYAPKKG